MTRCRCPLWSGARRKSSAYWKAPSGMKRFTTTTVRISHTARECGEKTEKIKQDDRKHEDQNSRRGANWKKTFLVVRCYGCSFGILTSKNLWQQHDTVNHRYITDIRCGNWCFVLICFKKKNEILNCSHIFFISWLQRPAQQCGLVS